MKALATRLKAMRGAVALACTLFVIGGVLGWFAWMNHYARAASASERAALERRIRQETIAMRTTEADARRFAGDYDRLAKSGVVGRWNKLGAIDRFEAALAPWRGSVGRYTVAFRADGATADVSLAPDPTATVAADLASPAQASAAGAAAAPLHRLAQARFSLEMQPSHEADLLAALDAGSRSDIGIADVERCEIARRTDSSEAALAVSCTLAWHSFEPLRAPAPVLPVEPARATGAEPLRPTRSVASIQLERLFFTPAERAAGPGSDAPKPPSSRPASAPVGAAGPRKVQGYVRRSDGPDVVWIDDRPSILVDPGALSEPDARVREGARLAPLERPASPRFGTPSRR